MDIEEFVRTHLSSMSQYVMVNNTNGKAAVVLDREVSALKLTFHSCVLNDLMYRLGKSTMMLFQKRKRGARRRGAKNSKK